MKNNIKRLWWKRFIQESPYNVGLDSAIFMNPKVWEASGHVGGFSDPLIDCKECKTRHRADKLIEAYDPSDIVKVGLMNKQCLILKNIILFVLTVEKVISLMLDNLN